MCEYMIKGETGKLVHWLLTRPLECKTLQMQMQQHIFSKITYFLICYDINHLNNSCRQNLPTWFPQSQRIIESQGIFSV